MLRLVNIQGMLLSTLEIVVILQFSKSLILCQQNEILGQSLAHD